jgi:tyrosinase
MYTPDAVRGTLQFGYTYPELVDWNVSAAVLTSNLRTEINMLYNPVSVSNDISSTAISRPVARAAETAHAFDHIAFDDAKKLGMNNLNMQWNIEIQVPRYAYDSPFAIDFFMGEPESDPRLRGTAANLIGSHAQFIASHISTMFPDGVSQSLVQGQVSLSHTLAAGLNRGLIRDLSPQSVVPILKKQLSWNARSADGYDIDVAALTGLSIIVTSRTAKLATSCNEFPTYGLLRYWPMVTCGKIGGNRRFDL